MAMAEKTIFLILAAAVCAASAQFPAHHPHLHGGCDGTLTVDENGVAFTGQKGHAWRWKLEDIEELRLAPDRVTVLTYVDNQWLLGRDRRYTFLGKVPAAELYVLLRPSMEKRLVAEIATPINSPAWSIAVKHLGRVAGSQGTLAFGENAVVYTTASKDDSRTWLYSDIDTISTSGPFQLTITTFERERLQYGDRRGFNFQLKEPIAEAKYNQLWLQVERKNGRLP
jgi:hypothetical protein